MVRRNPRLLARCKVLKSKKLIEHRTNGTTLRAICSDAGTAQGLSPSLVVFDEVQEQGADRAFHDSLLTGMGARDKENRCFISIGTASWDKTSLLWDLLQTPNSETFLKVNYTTAQDWTTEGAWIEANPNYNQSVKPDFLQTECERAKRSPVYEGEFRRKYLGQWTENETRFLRMDLFRQCRQPLPDLRHQSIAVCAFDLASRRDSCSAVLAIYKDDLVFILDKTWIPEAAVRQRQDIRFDLWEKNVWIEEGNIIDHRQVKEQILEWTTEYPIEKIGYDPFNASQTALELFQEGQIIEPVSQGVGRMSEPTKLLEQLVFANKLRYDSDLLEWEAQNLCVTDDNNGNIRPQKPGRNSPYRVDAMICVIMALRLLFGWQWIDTSNASPYQTTI